MYGNEKNFTRLLYVIVILVFVANIVMVIIYGATTFDAICGWICALSWCVTSWAIGVLNSKHIEKERVRINNLISFIKEQEQEIRRLEKDNEE